MKTRSRGLDSELALRILPGPTPTPAGDKPPRYIFSFRHRPSVYNSARFVGVGVSKGDVYAGPCNLRERAVRPKLGTSPRATIPSPHPSWIPAPYRGTGHAFDRRNRHGLAKAA